MAGTYTITENKSDSVKFRAMVSFNGREAEYYEAESLDPATINSTLQKVADEHADSLSAEAVSLEMVDGKVKE